MTRNSELLARAEAVLPGGVNSPVRAFRAVGGHPPYIVKASGARMTDADGKEYIDLVGSWGPMILGHAHPAVTSAIGEALANGTSFGACSPREVDLAERVVKLVPGVDVVRMTSSGTEATMAAIRLARAATGRSHIVKFDGCYHGHSDSLLQAAGSGVATLDLPDALGIPGAVSQLTLQAPFNDLHAVTELFDSHADKIAAVILEPVAGNMGVVPPLDGFLEGLRELCSARGALLIFDEVMTGFRLAPGGFQQACGITPDLTTMGKVIGGGLPVGAFGGKREYMQQIAPAGGVYHAGTLSGNPLAMAAGCATLDLMNADDAAAYDRLEVAGARLQEHLERGVHDAKIPALVQRVGSMITLFFTDRPAIRHFADAKTCDSARFGIWFREMLEAGIYLPPSAFEAWFISTAHDDATIDAIGDAHVRAVAKLT